MLDRLRDEDTTSYKSFHDRDELRDLILDDLAILLTERFDGVAAGQPVEQPARHNLPAQTSTFLGRGAELRDLHNLLGAEDVRLVTLTGPGGTGKTRLALEAAAQEVARFPGGVYFVDLSAERELDDAFAAVARAVGVAVPSEARPVDALKGELRRRRAFLVLDNFEQAMPAAVGVVELLEHCPDVKVLVTSREALRVRGERVVPVPPLSLPDPGDLMTADDAEAVLLFCDRAAAVQPGFALDQANRAAIIAICRQLDGLPLAIELAAARVELFDVDDLQVRLRGSARRPAWRRTRPARSASRRSMTPSRGAMTSSRRTSAGCSGCSRCSRTPDCAMSRRPRGPSRSSTTWMSSRASDRSSTRAWCVVNEGPTAAPGSRCCRRSAPTRSRTWRPIPTSPRPCGRPTPSTTRRQRSSCTSSSASPAAPTCSPPFRTSSGTCGRRGPSGPGGATWRGSATCWHLCGPTTTRVATTGRRSSSATPCSRACPRPPTRPIAGGTSSSSA